MLILKSIYVAPNSGFSFPWLVETKKNDKSTSRLL